MILEVIATSVGDAVLAEENGADRIELISGIMEGGVTPSLGLVEEVLRKVNIPVHVMIRPHANSFCYDEEDLAVMLRDIVYIRDLGAAGIVIGALTNDDEVDVASLRILTSEVGPMAVTFHRAFDEITQQQETLNLLTEFAAINRILTSGGQPSVLDAKEEIKSLVKQSATLPVTIMAGSGLQLETLADFIAYTGVKEVHLGTGVRINGQALAPIDPLKIQAAATILARFRE